MVAYFSTPDLIESTHRIDITVTMVNETNPFTIDYFVVASLAGATPHTHVGGVVGGVVGILVLAIAAWYFLRFLRSRGGAAEGRYRVC